MVVPMYYGSIEHSRIISAFERHVPGCFVTDQRDKGGFIAVCRGTKDMPWRDQTTTCNVYRTVPDVTLLSLPRGNVTAKTIYRGLALDRPGWWEQFRRAGRHISTAQKRRITKDLRLGEVFEGVI